MIGLKGEPEVLEELMHNVSHEQIERQQAFGFFRMVDRGGLPHNKQRWSCTVLLRRQKQQIPRRGSV